MIIGLRAGTQSHRFIGIWVVIVEKRAFRAILEPQTDRLASGVSQRPTRYDPSCWSGNRSPCHTDEKRALEGGGRSRLSGEVQDPRFDQIRTRSWTSQVEENHHRAGTPLTRPAGMTCVGRVGCRAGTSTAQCFFRRPPRCAEAGENCYPCLATHLLPVSGDRKRRLPAEPTAERVPGSAENRWASEVEPRALEN